MAQKLFHLAAPAFNNKCFALSAQPVSGFCGEGTIFGFMVAGLDQFQGTREIYGDWRPFSDATRSIVEDKSPKLAAFAVLSEMIRDWRWAVCSFADRVHHGSGLGAVLIDPLEDGEVLTINRIKWKVNKMKPFTNPNTRALCQRVELVRVQKEKKA